jgi:hypothetical protein
MTSTLRATMPVLYRCVLVLCHPQVSELESDGFGGRDPLQNHDQLTPSGSESIDT